MKKFIYLCLVIIIGLNGCSTNPVYRGNEDLLSLMRSNYYWSEYISDDLKKNTYTDIETLFGSLLHKPLDRYSIMLDYEYLSNILDGRDIEGNYGMYIIGLELNGSVNYYVRHIIPNSPLDIAGVKRGYRIVSINGEMATEELIYDGADAESGVWTFADFNNNEVTYNLSKAVYDSGSILLNKIINMNNKTIGYFLLDSFSSSDYRMHYKSLFDEFQNVDEMVVDLRFNGGGSVRNALTLIKYLIPEQYENEIIIRFQYNDNFENEDCTFALCGVNEEITNKPELNRIYFLVNRYSASASELLINALKPFMDVYVIGKTTSGKPVGSNLFRIDDSYNSGNEYGVLPITFEITNRDNEGGYFNGITPDYDLTDDYTKGYGMLDEVYLAQAINHIFNISPISKVTLVKQQIPIYTLDRHLYPMIDMRIDQ